MSAGAQLGLVVGVALLIVVVGFILRKHMRVLSVRVRGEAIRRDDIKRKILQIQEMLDLDVAQSRRLAVMEMYKLFDFVLKQMGFGGGTMKERLEHSLKYESGLQSMRHLYDLSHRLAGSKIAQVDDRQARQSLDQLRNALTTLHIL